MTWPYRELVLDLEPQGPLPPEIYKRRRMLAIGVAAFVLAIVVTVVVVVISNATGDTKTEGKPTASAASPTPLPGENPEVKSPVLPPAPQAPPPTPTPTAAVTPPPVLKEGDDCPDSTLAVKGITSQPDYVVGDQPKFTMVVTNIGLVACKRDAACSQRSRYTVSFQSGIAFPSGQPV